MDRSATRHSEVMTERLSRLRRGAMPADQLAVLLKLLDSRGGTATRVAVARALNVPEAAARQPDRRRAAGGQHRRVRRAPDRGRHGPAQRRAAQDPGRSAMSGNRIAAPSVSQSGVSEQRRREVIDALRRGTVPSHGLDALAVGLGRFEDAVDEALEQAAVGGAVFKAVRGEYGAGKTFFTRWLAQRARARGFASTEIQISENETPLHRLETVYRRLSRAPHHGRVHRERAAAGGRRLVLRARAGRARRAARRPRARHRAGSRPPG